MCRAKLRGFIFAPKDAGDLDTICYPKLGASCPASRFCVVRQDFPHEDQAKHRILRIFRRRQ
jgi:hypothetical protein